jgi:hypothetical protein
LRLADVVIWVIENPTDEIVPAAGLLIDHTGFKAFAEETTAGGRGT